MKKILLTTILLALSYPILAEVKIGYINIERVVKNSLQYIEAQKKIRAEFKPKEIAFVKLNKQVKTLVKNFNQERSGLKENEAKKRIKKIAKLEQQLKGYALKMQQTLNKKNIKLLAKIQKQINFVILKIAKAQKYDLILYQEVAYANNNINITDLIAEKLNALYKK
jgi:outer membrane protein